MVPVVKIGSLVGVESITSATVLHEDDIIRGNLEEDSEGV
jgi:hypothetical protein